MNVVFDFLKQQIGIDGDGPELVQVLTLVRDIAPNLPSINIVTHQVAGNSEQRGNTTFKPENQGSGATQTLRQFVRSMSLDNAYERIAAIAYYQNKVVGRGAFSPKELGDWFTQAGFQKPSQMPVALSDSRRRYGYVENSGRGEWRITTNGENLIVGKLENGSEQKVD